MNARLYDPLIGRFMQGDPVVGDPFDIQTYNAYSYVYNRPLNTVDADGRCGMMCAALVGAIIGRATGMIDQQTFRQILGIWVAVALGPQGYFALTENALANAAIAGFASGAVSTGNMKGATQGAFSSLVFYGAGSLGSELSGNAASSAKYALSASGAADRMATAAFWSESGLGRVLLHAGAGCITSVVGGGECGRGALAAGAAQGLGGRVDAGNPIGNVAIHALVGGTASVIGGGKFANGAQSGAFGYLFNQSAHDERPSQPGSLGPVVGDPKPIIDLLSGIADRFSGPSYAESYRERALKAAGITEAEALNLDVHHIVERNSAAAAPARVSLAKVGIGVDDLENLMIISRADHKPLHTGQYITTVNAVMTASVPGGRPAVILQLNLIKTSIYVKGTFP